MVESKKIVELQLIEPPSIHELVASGSLTEVKSLIAEKKVPVDEKNDYDQTALHAACEAGRDDIVSLLLDHYADPRLQDIDGACPLAAASKRGSLECVKLLIEARADVHASDNIGWTPLMWGCYKGHTKIVEMLLYEGASFHVHVAYNMTCLLWAAGRGHADIVKLLCTKGAKVNATDKFGSTPLMWACRRGYVDVVGILFDFNADADVVGANGANALISSAQNGYDDCVAAILAQRSVNVNHTDKDTNSALSYAAKLGRNPSIIRLLNAGAYLNLADKNGDTPLIKAIKHGHLEAVRALLTRFADVDVRGKNDATALHWACEHGHIGIVRELLACNADTEVVTGDGDTPLLHAVKSKNVTICRMLLDKGAKVTATDKKKDTPLHVAIRARSLRLVKLLLRNPNDSRLLYQPNKAGETPYNLDAAHNKSILGSVFGAKNLSPESVMNEASSDGVPQSYDLYSSALADILCEPTLKPPLTVGLYAKWGSGKSFLLKRLEEQIKVFTIANKVKMYRKPSFASFVIVFLISVFLGLLTSTLTPNLRVTAGAIVGCSIFFTYSFIAFLITIGMSIGSWEWANTMGNFAHQQYNHLALLFKLWFMKPPALKQTENGKAVPVRFLFTTYSRLTSVGGETSLAEMIGLLSMLAEKKLGFLTVRLYRAFATDVHDNIQPTARYKKICCLPTFVLAILFVLSFCAVILLTTTAYGPQPTLLSETISDDIGNETTAYFTTAILGSIIVFAALDLLLFIVASPTLAAMCGALLWSQHSRVLYAARHAKVPERLMQQLKKEVDILRRTVTAIDAFTEAQTRMCVIINGLDSCEQDKVLQVLDTVHVLFSQSPYITILAIDPVIVAKAIHGNLNSLFRDANISGHDYLKNIVHLPFYLKDRRQTRKEKGRSGSVQEDGLSGEEDETGEGGVGGKKAFSGKGGMFVYRRANGFRRSQKSVDLGKLMFSEDWFNSVSPQLMKRILNIVSLTGRLLRADTVEFSWPSLAAWINLTEQWPYRASFILYTLNKSEKIIPPNTPLQSIFDQSPFCLSFNDPMLAIDSSDDRSFRAFLSARPLTARDVHDFVPSTINLDPKLCDYISEDPYGALRHGSLSRLNLQSVDFHAQRQYRQPANERPKNPEVTSPTVFSNSRSNISPFSAVQSSLPINDWSTVEVAQHLRRVRGIVPGNLQKYEDFIHTNNINGSVLVACDLDDLKKEIFAPFGDWSLIKQWILQLRACCFPDNASGIATGTHTYDQLVGQRYSEDAVTKHRPASPPRNAPSDANNKGSEESLGFDSLRGSDRVAYNDAFKEYLRLQPGSSESFNTVDKASITGLLSRNVDQTSGSSSSSGSVVEPTAQMSPAVNELHGNLSRDDLVTKSSSRLTQCVHSVPGCDNDLPHGSLLAEDITNGNDSVVVTVQSDSSFTGGSSNVIRQDGVACDINANVSIS